MSESPRAEYKSAELDLREALLNWLERHPELTYGGAIYRDGSLGQTPLRIMLSDDEQWQVME